jgi:hypothetical protein
MPCHGTGVFLPCTNVFQQTWLPREIFADIGIVDPVPTIITESEEATAVAAVEEIAVQFISIIGTNCGKSPPHTHVLRSHWPSPLLLLPYQHHATSPLQ